MPGAVVHFLVLNRILDKLCVDKEDISLLYAGVIAPDAVHAKKDYIRRDKKTSHLRVDIRDADFYLQDNLNLFHKRVRAFSNHYLCNNKKYSFFYIGYLIHLYTDELFILSVRKAYKEWKEKQGYKVEDKMFYKTFINDVEVLDSHILSKLDNRDDIINRLNHFKCQLKVLNLDHNHLRTSRKWVIDNKLISYPMIEKPVFIEIDRVDQFISEASEKILKRIQVIMKEFRLI